MGNHTNGSGPAQNDVARYDEHVRQRWRASLLSEQAGMKADLLRQANEYESEGSESMAQLAQELRRAADRIELGTIDGLSAGSAPALSAEASNATSNKKKGPGRPPKAKAEASAVPAPFAAPETANGESSC